jgi:tetratricopeptide (TPR) repeat protein
MARAVGSPTLLIEAALLYTDHLALGFSDPGARQLLDEALRIAGEDQPAKRSQLLCNYALYRAINEGGGQASGIEMLHEALQLARRSGDDVALALALGTRCILLLGTPDAAAQLRTAAELEGVLNGSPQTRQQAQDAAYRRRIGPAESGVLRHRALAALQLGDRATFDESRQQLRNLADINHDVLTGAITILWDGLVALMEGRVGHAEALLDRLLDASPAGDRNLLYSHAAQLFHLRRDQGRIAEVLPLFEELTGTSEQLAVGRAHVALGYHDLGRNADARQTFEALAADGFAGTPRDATWSCALAVLAELCWHLRDEERAALLQPLCEPYAGQLVVVAWGACCLGAMDRFRGMLADVLRQSSVAGRRFAAAAALEDRVNAIAPLARTRIAWAASSLRTDPQEARRLVDLAATTVKDLGLHGHDVTIAQLQEAVATRTDG